MLFDPQPRLLVSSHFGKHVPFFRLTSGGSFTINKNALSILGNPQNVLFWYSKQRNILLLTAVEQPTAHSFFIAAYCYSSSNRFQIRTKAFTASLLRCAQWNDTNTYVVCGERVDQFGAIAFPLDKAMIEEVSLNV